MYTLSVFLVTYLFFAAVGIYVHELGHAVANWLLGYKAVSIKLQVIWIWKVPVVYSATFSADRNPLDIPFIHRAFISIAGPLANLTSGAMALWYVGGTPYVYKVVNNIIKVYITRATFQPISLQGVFLIDTLTLIGVMNIIIALYNMIPILPFDGGMIFLNVYAKLLGNSLEKFYEFASGTGQVLLIIAYAVYLHWPK